MTTRQLPTFLAFAAAALAAAAPAAGAAPTTAPSLIGRAILPADATSPAPFPGVINTDPAPAPGATQPVGGFSALIGAGDKYTYWAMPDNGFGTKANSRSFLLRLYKVHADFRTTNPSSGNGDVTVLDTITLHDPDHKIPFRLVNDGTPDRLLTGGDFDIESVRQTSKGDFWFGEEFGPFLLHVDATGKVLEAPIPLPDVKSPDYPADFPAPVQGAANLPSSAGFEGMALSQDGSRLYPTLEGAVAGDDPQVRRMYEFDIRHRKWTSVVRRYRVGTPGDATTNGYSVSDLTKLDATHLIGLERDNGQGATARWKRGFVIDLNKTGADGTLVKKQVVDLLNLSDRKNIAAATSTPRPGDIGVGAPGSADPFAMPYQTIEAVLPTGDDRLAVVNDTNFGSTGRNPSLPDYSDFIKVRVPGLRDYDDN
jgi:hypothetical protein